MRMFVVGLALLGMGACATRTTSARVGDVEIRSFRRAYSAAHVVTRGGVQVLVDTGYAEETPALDAAMRKAGVDPKRWKAIIVTHAHGDHAGGARYFHEHYGTPIIAGAADRAAFAGGHNEKLCPVGALGRSRYKQDQAGQFDPLVADTWIDQPTSLSSLLGFDGTVAPYPSHTPGSIALVVGKVALVGDLFRGGILGDSAEVHFFMCDVAANRADVVRLLGELGKDVSTFFPGHFGPLSRSAIEARFSR